MKILITGDLHITSKGKTKSSQDRIRYTNQLFNDMVKLIKTHEIEEVIFVGDIFDFKYNVDIEAIKCFYDGLHLVASCNNGDRYSISINWLYGNHDYPLNNLYNMLNFYTYGIIEYTAYIIGHMVPWTPYNEFTKIEHSDNVLPYVYTHYGVEEIMVNGLKLNTGVSVKDFKLNEMRYVFSGHYHTPCQIENFVYVGSPYPLKFDEKHKPSVIILNTDTQTFHREPLSSKYPEFHDYIGDSLYTMLAPSIKEIQNTKNYVRITCTPEQYPELKKSFPNAIFITKSNDKIIQSQVKKEISESENDLAVIKKYANIYGEGFDRDSLCALGEYYLRKAGGIL